LEYGIVLNNFFPKIKKLLSMKCNHTLLSREAALQLALTPPRTVLNATFDCPVSAFSLPVRKLRPVYDVALFGFEADTLEVRLVETFGLVTETILVESAFDHHGVEKSCIWEDILKHTARFQPFVNGVRSHCMRQLPREIQIAARRIEWRFETWQAKSVKTLVHTLPQNAIVIFGHVDEVPLRHVWMRVATGNLGVLPTNIAIKNLRGHAEKAHRSDFPARGYPESWGSPMVTRPDMFNGNHARGKYKDVWLMGGVHMTNYCYAGNRVLKEWTATEARIDYMWKYKPSCASIVRGCRRVSHELKAQEVSPQELPLLLRCAPNRLPEWWHKNDPRLYMNTLYSQT
jgi:hypothetical protein